MPKTKKKKGPEWLPGQYESEKTYDFFPPHLPMIESSVQEYCRLILEYGAQGKPIDSFFIDYQIRKSFWDAYVKKYPRLQKAWSDAKAFAKSQVLLKLETWSHDKDMNASIAKIYIENMTGWGLAEYDERTTPNVKIRVYPTKVEDSDGSG